MAHSFEDHTGEVEMRLEAPTLPALFSEACRALGELMLGEEVEPPPDGPIETVTVEADDREALLVAWLDELVFRAETRKAVFTRCTVEHASDRAITATLRGVPEPTLKTGVKAATYHRLRVAEEDGAWRATVVLDV